ncbi:MAG TPA: hydrogenase formation protein HypD [Planctomycetota bacterium]|nr:hydrogenase formation protein HypD [Planctomycetota bacterium]
MNFQEEFRNKDVARGLVAGIRNAIQSIPPVVLPVRLMEVCGSHTMAICRYGIRQLLPEPLRLLSGPGCPVCVTTGDYIDKAVALARIPGVVVTSFGDLFKVPGSTSSLEKERAGGAAVEVMFSPIEAVRIARDNPAKKVVFLGIGFETTIPAVAIAIKEAAGQGVENFSVLSGHKLMPPALRALAEGGTRVNGFICPGHVSTIIGMHPYEFIARDYRIGCVIAGFEPLDILQSIHMLLRQIKDGEPAVENQYTRLVRPEGNRAGQAMINEVFEPVDVAWRGLGVIPGSGLRIREQFAAHDTERTIEFAPEPTVEKPGCICGEILQGIKTPYDCPLFGKYCTPAGPVGPCMVSTEGCCAASYKYLEPMKR